MGATVQHSISHGEQYVEEGIVTSTEPGRAYVLVPEKGECEECTAKIFCKSDIDRTNERKVLVRDPFGVHPGDKVRIVVKGNVVMTAGWFLYGVPLGLLVGMLFLGMALFKYSASPELYAFSLAVVVLACYFFGLFYYGKRRSSDLALPEITQYTMHP